MLPQGVAEQQCLEAGVALTLQEERERDSTVREMRWMPSSSSSPCCLSCVCLQVWRNNSGWRQGLSVHKRGTRKLLGRRFSRVQVLSCLLSRLCLQVCRKARVALGWMSEPSIVKPIAKRLTGAEAHDSVRAGEGQIPFISTRLCVLMSKL